MIVAPVAPDSISSVIARRCARGPRRATGEAVTILGTTHIGSYPRNPVGMSINLARRLVAPALRVNHLPVIACIDTGHRPQHHRANLPTVCQVRGANLRNTSRAVVAQTRAIPEPEANEHGGWEKRDIVVIGASAGGVQALKTLFSCLPGSLDAAVFVVLHTSPNRPSALPRVWSSTRGLEIANAEDSEPIRYGRVYVAPPDRHLLIEHGHVHLSAGPKENRARPAINPLFRSAGLAYGARVVGVILTGLLDDGTLGLWEVKRRGGIAIVQEPDDAEYDQMPKSAVQNVTVDYRVPLSEIAPLLVSLSKEPIETRKEKASFAMHAKNTNLTCPECHGPLQRMTYGRLTELRCRVGHAYAPESALVAHDEAEERILWSAVQTLEEGADLGEQLVDAVPKALAKQLRGKINVKRILARRIREVVEEVTAENNAASVREGKGSAPAASVNE